jgi:hypothetical protein
MFFVKPNMPTPKRTTHATRISLTKRGVERLIARNAKKLGVSYRTALRRVRTGTLGDSYLWADISMLSTLISRKK